MFSSLQKSDSNRPSSGRGGRGLSLQIYLELLAHRKIRLLPRSGHKTVAVGSAAHPRLAVHRHIATPQVVERLRPPTGSKTMENERFRGCAARPTATVSDAFGIKNVGKPKVGVEGNESFSVVHK